MYQGIDTKVMTGEVRLSYAHLDKPYANPKQPGAEPKYSVTLLIPKTDTATKADIDQSMRAAYEKGVAGDWKGARPQLKNAIIYDGDGVRPDGTPFAPECHGFWVMTASTKRKPQVVHISNPAVELMPNDIYSGMWARVSVNFYPYTGQQKGVAAGLSNVFKTRDDEAFAGGASAASEFEGIAQWAAQNAVQQPSQAGWQQAAPTAPQPPVQPAYAPQQTAYPGGINPLTGELM